MTKKDFILIASILKKIKENIDAWDEEKQNDIFKDWVENYFCEILSSKYPKFQKDKFLIACGVKDEKAEADKLYKQGMKTLAKINWRRQ